MQFRHRSRADHRGDRAPAEARRRASHHHHLSAREHRRPHGGGLRLRDRARSGRAGSCRRRHGEHRDSDAQHLPQPAPGAADGRQGALYHRQRTGRLARYLRPLRAGAVRSGEPRAPLSQVGMDAAVRHRGERSAAARALHHAERAAGPGLSDDAAGDADAALERGRRSPLRRRAARHHHRRRRRSQAGDAARRPAAGSQEPDPDHRLRRTQSARVRADHGAGRVRRHRRVRVEHDQQHLARQSVLPRVCARQASAQRRRGPPRRRGRAVVPERRRGQREHVLGPYRRRHSQARFADVDLSRQSAHAGQQRAHP